MLRFVRTVAIANLLVGAASPHLGAQTLSPAAKADQPDYKLGYIEVPVDSSAPKSNKLVNRDELIQVQLQSQFLELDVEQIKALGVDLHQLGGVKGEPAEAMVQKAAQTPAIQKMIAALVEQRLAKVVGEPTLITLSGRRARFRAGGDVSLDQQKQASVGIELSCTPQVRSADQIELELQSSYVTVASPDVSSDQEALPRRVRKLEIETSVVIQDGGTCVLISSDDAHESKARRLLILVTAHRLPQ